MNPPDSWPPYTVRLNAKPASDREVARHQDFQSLLRQHQRHRRKPPLHLKLVRGLIYLGLLLLVVLLLLFSFLYSAQQEQQASPLPQAGQSLEQR